MKSSALILSLAALTLSPALAKPQAKLLIDHLQQPIYLTAPTGSNDYLYVVEKPGVIKLFDRKSGSLLAEPFLDISEKIHISMNEQGLLGMAFSPDFAQDKRFYLYYTDTTGDTKLARFTATDSKHADAGSEEILLTQKQDFKNHNGGWIDFGPDKMLYIGLGDGGSANDPNQRAQNLNTLLGKLLRIDVSPATGYAIPADNPFKDAGNARPEILAYGLRNPWRCSWDNDTLILADVGQNAWEEINAVPHAQLFSANFSWPQIEAFTATQNPKAQTQNPGASIRPSYAYPHNAEQIGGFSITGGYVYRGSVEELRGRYFFADFVQPRIWSGKLSSAKLTDLQHHKDDFSQNGKAIQQVSSFATDPQGEMYIISHLGQVYQITE